MVYLTGKWSEPAHQCRHETTTGRTTLVMTTDNETGQAPSTASGRCVDLRPSQVSALDLYDQLDADGSALHAVCFMAVSGPLDRPAAELATRFVGSAHPLLSVTFCAERGLATPAQPQDLLWLTCDDARAAVAHVATRRFSLGDETALRVAVAQDSSRTLLAFVSHAVACDRRSTEVIASDWARAYRQAIGGQAPAGGPPQPQPQPQPSAGNRERTTEFWRTRLSALDQLELPHDLSAEATWQFADQIDGEGDIPLQVLRQAAARHRVSVFAMLVTAVVAALARMRPAASRHVLFSLDGHGAAQAQDVGPLSTAAFICVPGTEIPLGQLADNVKRELLTVLGHRQPSMDEVLLDLDPPTADRVRSVLGGLAVDFRPAVPDLDLGPGTRAHEITIEPVDGSRARSLALGLEFIFAERDSLVHASLAFNPTLFSTTQAHSILREVAEILDAL